MKKILIVTLLAFLLVGCSNSKSTNVSNANEVIWKSNKASYTAGDLYKGLKSQDYTSILVNKIVNKIGELEGLDMDSFNTDADANVQEVLDQGGEDYIIYYYSSVDNYRDALINSYIMDELLRVKANEVYDESKTEYLPYQAEIAYFDTLEAAQAVVDSVNGGLHTFPYSSIENGYTKEIAPTVFSDVSEEIPLEVKDYVLNNGKIGLSDPIETKTVTTDANGETVETYKYYVINLISTNADEFKEDFINYLVANTISSKDVVTEYMNKHNVKFYDQETYELFKKNYGEFK